MNFNEKKELSRFGELSKEASAVRLRAALQVSGLTQTALASRVGRGVPSINNTLKGLQFPGVEVMEFFYEEYGIDFNFFYKGAFQQLSGTVQEKLFAALADYKSAGAKEAS